MPTDKPMSPQRPAGPASKPNSRKLLAITARVPPSQGAQKPIRSMGSRGVFSRLGFNGGNAFAGFMTLAGSTFDWGFMGSGVFGGNTGRAGRGAGFGLGFGAKNAANFCPMPTDGLGF